MPPPPFVEERNSAYDDYGEDYRRKIGLRIGDYATDEISERGNPARPQDRPDGVVQKEDVVIHAPYSGKYGHERTHDRHKTREDDGALAVPVEKGLRAFHMFSFEEAGILAFEYRDTDFRAEPVTHVVAENSRRYQEGKEDPDIENIGGGEHARGKEKAPAGEEESEENTRFEEYDRRNAGVADELDHLHQINVEKIGHRVRRTIREWGISCRARGPPRECPLAFSRHLCSSSQSP